VKPDLPAVPDISPLPEIASLADATSNNVCIDPYRSPGYLHIPQQSSGSAYHDTQWIPYTEHLWDAPDPNYVSYPPPDNKPVYFSPDKYDDEFSYLEDSAAPKNWMKSAVHADRARKEAAGAALDDQGDAESYKSMKDEQDLGWLWGRRVLIVGDRLVPRRQYLCYVSNQCLIPINLIF
jgi:hypothetical protein